MEEGILSLSLSVSLSISFSVSVCEALLSYINTLVQYGTVRYDTVQCSIHAIRAWDDGRSE